ncbi:MAG: rhodanese-like domain-containing protein [Luteolibacter sp.]
MSHLSWFFCCAATLLGLASCISREADPTKHQQTQLNSADPSSNTANSQTAEKPTQRKRGEVSSIGFDEFFQLHQADKTLPIDARPSYFYHLGHIPGAINLPKSVEIEPNTALIQQLNRASNEERALVVYCNGLLCPDARTIARRLARIGFDTYIFSGGWNAWTDAGLPPESSPANRKTNR